MTEINIEAGKVTEVVLLDGGHPVKAGTFKLGSIRLPREGLLPRMTPRRPATLDIPAAQWEEGGSVVTVPLTAITLIRSSDPKTVLDSIHVPKR